MVGEEEEPAETEWKQVGVVVPPALRASLIVTSGLLASIVAFQGQNCHPALGIEQMDCETTKPE